MVGRVRIGEPPMQPRDAASHEKLRLARERGEAYRKAVIYMVQEEADGASLETGLAEHRFPPAPPYTLQQTFDPGFLPD